MSKYQLKISFDMETFFLRHAPNFNFELSAEELIAEALNQELIIEIPQKPGREKMWGYTDKFNKQNTI